MKKIIIISIIFLNFIGRFYLNFGCQPEQKIENKHESKQQILLELQKNKQDLIEKLNPVIEDNKKVIQHFKQLLELEDLPKQQKNWIKKEIRKLQRKNNEFQLEVINLIRQSDQLVLQLKQQPFPVI